MDDEYRLIAKIYAPLLEPLLAPVRAEVAALAAQEGWRLVLDVGGGTGGQCVALHHLGVRCLLLDRSPAMLRAAWRERMEGRALLVQGDAAAVPLADGAVDAALFSLCLHEMEPALRRAALAEAGRVARAVVVADYAEYAGDARPRAGSRARELLARWVAHVPERLAGRRHYRMFRDYLTRGGAAGLLAEAGFRVRVRRNVLQGALAVMLAVPETVTPQNS
ncbi:methyltransferase domain-containing protein [Megalodesulfovibrio paquesii]